MKRGTVKRNTKSKVKRKPIASLEKPRLTAASGGHGHGGWGGGGGGGAQPTSPDSRRCIGGY